MVEMLEFAFMRRAILGGVLVAIVASYFSVFVVQRRMGFFGAGLAHSSFGGVALALLLKLPTLLVATPFTVLAALLIQWLRKRTKLEMDTIIGVIFSTAMALGILFLYLREDYSSDAMTFLFGSILAIGALDLWLAVFLLILTIIFLPLWKRWAFGSFDRDLAKASGLPVERDDLLLILFIALTVVVSIKLLGIILLSAYLVIPGASARLLSKDFYRMTIVSIVIGVLSTLIGVILSYEIGVPTGALIILVQALTFFSASVVKRIKFAR